MSGEKIIVMTKKCPICGDIGEVVMPAEDAEYGANLRWAGSLIQECYPTLSPALREQVLTGTHPECWNELLGITEQTLWAGVCDADKTMRDAEKAFKDAEKAYDEAYDKWWEENS